MVETNCHFMLSLRERQEWHLINGYSSKLPKEQRFENFKKEIKKINLNDIPEALYKEWRYYRECKYNEDSIVNQYSEFLKKWPKDFNYDELNKISGELLDEWRLKCNYEHIYENYDTLFASANRGKNTVDGKYIERPKAFELKNKCELWKEFKEYWLLDDGEFPNMEVFNKIKKAVEDYENEFDMEEFFEFREDANYHSYDSYSIAEQYQICKEFDEINCK